MIETHLNLFDAAVIGVMILSCIFAFFRGFVREMLSLGAWIGAALVTVYYFPDMAVMLKPYFKSQIGATGVGTLGIYTISLIGFSVFNAIILKFIRSGKEVGMLDNLLGLGFGAARGVLLVSLGYFTISIALPEGEQPAWLTQSMTRPYAERGAIQLAKAAPEYLREISYLNKQARQEMQAEQQLKKDVLSEHEDIEYVKKNSNDGDEPGYSRSETERMDQLLQRTSPSR